MHVCVVYVLISFALLPAPLSFVFRISFVPHDATARLERTLRNKHACNRCRSIKCQLTCDNKCIRHIKKDNNSNNKCECSACRRSASVAFTRTTKADKSIDRQRTNVISRERAIKWSAKERARANNRQGACVCVCVKESAHLRESNKSNKCWPKTKIV